MMLGEFRIVVAADVGRERPRSPERHWTGYCFAQQRRLFSVDEAGQI
jgi:hypothetical protein